MKQISLASEQALQANLEAARSRGTRRAYQHAWTQFSVRYGNHLPANPLDVALYLSELGTRATPSTVRLHASAIASRHKEAGHESPTAHPGVIQALQGHARLMRHVPKQATGIDAAAFEQIYLTAQQPRITRGGRMETVKEATLRGLVDMCLVGIMRDALLRRSECASLRWCDWRLEDDRTGRLLIRMSKTDQEGAGSVRFVSEGVMAIMHSLQIIRSPATGQESIFELSASQICRRIRAACAQAGLVGDFSGHSPRIGMAIDLARSGVSLPALMEAGRWKSPSMPAHYVRAVEAGSGAVAQWYQSQLKSGKNDR